MLVTSVPGAGKTRVVQAKAIQETSRVAGTPRRVTCLTYTKAAATELSRRILPGLSEDLRDSIVIGTIHSFCLQEILSPHAGRLTELPHGHGVATPENPVAEVIIADLLGHAPDNADLAAFAEVARTSDGGPRPHRRLSSAQIISYWEALRDSGLIDFSGVLYYATLLLQRFPDVARAVACSFSWFLVDEYQDTAVSQIQIMELIANAGSCHWMLIGDFNQSIFGFNEVSREVLVRFATDRNCAPLTLTESYRCRPAVASKAMALISEPAIMSHYKFPDATITSSVGNVQQCTGQFVSALKRSGIRYSSAAIIAPARWALLDAIMALDAIVPQVPWSAQFRFPGVTEVSTQACALLACAHHRKDPGHVASALQGISDLLEVEGWRPEMVDVEKAAFRCVADILNIGIEKLSLVDVVGILFGRICEIVPRQLHRFMRSMVEVATRDSILAASPLSKWNGLALARTACTHDSVTLSTIHGSKGLEFDAVLLASFEANVLPHRNTTDISEERRKAYVAITRPRHFLMYGFSHGCASPFYVA